MGCPMTHRSLEVGEQCGDLLALAPRSVATKITGHRTESVYRRYAIVSDAELQEAARKLSATKPATVANSEVDRQR